MPNTQNKLIHLGMKTSNIHSITGSTWDFRILDKILSKKDSVALPASTSHNSHIPSSLDSSIHCLLLNTRLPSFFETIFSQCSIRICADGAANLLYTSKAQLPIPTHICGDLDSVKEQVLLTFEKEGCEIIHVKDQNTSDLEKCWNVLSSKMLPHDKLFVLGAFGGRFDHEMKSFNFLYQLAQEKRRYHAADVSKKENMNTASCYPEIYLLGDVNVAVILDAGHSEILFSDLYLTRRCALLPIGEPCKSVTTDGLYYEMHEATLSFSGLISTSNWAVKDVISIQTSNPIILYFEMEEYSAG